ncbi:hypothetical protein L598_000700000730 [Mesorhizobium sp. J18]|uniref:hypothetical protein n=1 Tax=Mesorhizobium sp. J18 TaxID=935263 RepID=UPI00119ABFB3|nr:hypothetical protein [Mesorhizobium sp. J18]TWG90316.1 hypothetical protein L598_000700000730 [Mesorhizobium sp. J18]
MDIAGIYNYETLFPLELVRPDTEEKIGITFQIRSASSAEAKKVLRKHVDEVTERQQRGKLVKGEMRLRQELEKAASWIASWDWGEHTYGGEKPEFSFKKAVEILDREDWIYQQVAEAANSLANFTKESPKTAAKP